MRLGFSLAPAMGIGGLSDSHLKGGQRNPRQAVTSKRASIGFLESSPAGA